MPSILNGEIILSLLLLLLLNMAQQKQCHIAYLQWIASAPFW